MKWLGTIDELQAMEAWFGTDDPEELAARYDAAITALESESVEAWLADAARAGVSDGAAAHFTSDWLDGTTIPGVDRSTMERELRSGFTAALTAARDNGLKTSMLWVMAGESSGGFGVDHLVGANAVTVVISVPSGTRAAAEAPSIMEQ
jgi:hypothetical protein